MGTTMSLGLLTERVISFALMSLEQDGLLVIDRQLFVRLLVSLKQ